MKTLKQLIEAFKYKHSHVDKEGHLRNAEGCGLCLTIEQAMWEAARATVAAVSMQKEDIKYFLSDD